MNYKEKYEKCMNFIKMMHDMHDLLHDDILRMQTMIIWKEKERMQNIAWQIKSVWYEYGEIWRNRPERLNREDIKL